MDGLCTDCARADERRGSRIRVARSLAHIEADDITRFDSYGSRLYPDVSDPRAVVRLARVYTVLYWTDRWPTVGHHSLIEVAPGRLRSRVEPSREKNLYIRNDEFNVGNAKLTRWLYCKLIRCAKHITIFSSNVLFPNAAVADCLYTGRRPIVTEERICHCSAVSRSMSCADEIAVCMYVCHGYWCCPMAVSLDSCVMVLVITRCVICNCPPVNHAMRTLDRDVSATIGWCRKFVQRYFYVTVLYYSTRIFCTRRSDD